MTSTGILSLCAITACAAGVWLIRRGIAGVAIDDHMTCHACGYDLFGSVLPIWQCSECGANLRKGIRVGNRRKLLPWIWGGGASIFVSLLIAVPTLLTTYGAIDWPAHEPYWWLRRQALAAPPFGPNPGLTEIERRYQANSLASVQTNDLLQTALALQADAKRPWDQRWGDLIQKEYAAGRLSQEQLLQYLSHAVDLKVSLRPTVRRGAVLPINFSTPYGRQGPNAAGQEFSLSSIRLTIDGHPAALLDPCPMGSVDVLYSGNKSPEHAIDLSPLLPQLADGEHQVDVTVPVKLIDWPSRVTSMGWTVHSIRHFTIVPATQPTVVSNSDQRLGPILRKCVSIDAINLYQQFGNRVGGSEKSTWHLEGHFSFAGSPLTPGRPVGLACEVFARSKDREWTLGTFAIPADDRSWSSSIMGDVDESLQKQMTVDLVLRPSVTSAEQTTSINTIYGNEIVIKDVPLKRP